MIRIGLNDGYRTSGGGANFNHSLAAALEAIPKVDLHSLPSDKELDAAVFTGTQVHPVDRNTPSILWPLNVAPLEPDTVRVSSTSPRSFARYRLLKARMWNSVSKADALVFGSEYARDLHREHFPRCRELPTVVIRGGAPSLPPSTTPDISPEAGRVLMVSHCYPYKLIVEAIEGFRLAAFRTSQPMRLRIAGKLADPAYAKKIRRAMVGAEQVELLGNLGPAELDNEYQLADVVLFTSRSENAGSFALFDAFHRDKPVVSSFLSSIPEVAGDAPHYVDPRQPESIANGLLAVAGSPAYRVELSERSRVQAQGALRWEDRAQALVDFLEGLRK